MTVTEVERPVLFCGGDEVKYRLTGYCCTAWLGAWAWARSTVGVGIDKWVKVGSW